MPTLRQILAAHSPALLLDAASSRVQVGWLDAAGPGETANSLATSWRSSDEPATAAVFACIERLGRNPGEARAFLFSDGPGSVLGIRTVAMALRTWNVLNPRPTFAYCSLALVAHAMGRADVAVIADARRDSWHHYQIGHGLRRVPPQQVVGEVVMPENFRHWAAPPGSVGTTSYDVAQLLPRVADEDLFQETDRPDAFLHEEPSYVTWTPQIHRAPSERVTNPDTR